MTGSRMPKFTPKQRERVLTRDRYRCVFCGNGTQEGEDLCVDLIRPLKQGEYPTILNGWTICLRHYFMRNDYGMSDIDIMTDMFANLQEAAIKNNNPDMQKFTEEVLDVCKKNAVGKSAKSKK